MYAGTVKTRQFFPRIDRSRVARRVFGRINGTTATCPNFRVQSPKITRDIGSGIGIDVDIGGRVGIGICDRRTFVRITN